MFEWDHSGVPTSRCVRSTFVLVHSVAVMGCRVHSSPLAFTLAHLGVVEFIRRWCGFTLARPWSLGFACVLSSGFSGSFVFAWVHSCAPIGCLVQECSIGFIRVQSGYCGFTRARLAVVGFIRGRVG